VSKTCLCLALLLGAVAATLPRPAAADQSWQSSEAAWRAMDNCTRAAQKAFPDFTQQGYAKREAARLACLHSENLPGDEPAPPPVQQPAGQP
jgi:hypothetical protein